MNNVFSDLPDDICDMIKEYIYPYSDPIWHHIGCNIYKFKNDKYKCNCLFRLTHYVECKFIKSFNSLELDRENSLYSAGFIHKWASSHTIMCNCVHIDTVIPKKKICNICFTRPDHCSKSDCIECLLCKCGNILFLLPD